MKPCTFRAAIRMRTVARPDRAAARARSVGPASSNEPQPGCQGPAERGCEDRHEAVRHPTRKARLARLMLDRAGHPLKGRAQTAQAMDLADERQRLARAAARWPMRSQSNSAGCVSSRLGRVPLSFRFRFAFVSHSFHFRPGPVPLSFHCGSSSERADGPCLRHLDLNPAATSRRWRPILSLKVSAG